mgnify:CR=1 FL=1
MPGVVVVEPEHCIGCLACVDACPFGAIYVGPEHSVQKCDLCGGDPLCVKYCPWETIEMIASEQAFDVAKEWTERTVLPGKEWMLGTSAEVGEFFPTVFYGNKPENL